MRGLQKHGHILVDVANEDHRCLGSFLFLASSKRAGSHVVFHDLDAIFILKGDASDLVKRNAVPHTNKADLFCTDVVEQIGNSRLSARDQNTVRRDFFVNMRLTGAAGAKLTVVKVILNQRKHTGK